MCRPCPCRVIGLAVVTFMVASALAAPPSAAPGFSVVVTPAGGINASTYNSGSFQVSNTSTASEAITRVRLDLGTAALPDIVFDPVGAGGDLVAKCFTADSGAQGTGLVAPADPCVTPFSGPHAGGYDVMQIDFTSPRFGPAESFTFSVDIDPTTIKGVEAPGPGESGSVSGLELTGATVEVTFNPGGVLTARLLRTTGSLSGAQVVAPTLVALSTPSVAALGVAVTPATVTALAQTIRVGGPAGANVRLVRIEAALYTDGLVGGGFEVEPFEANSSVAVGQNDAVVGAGGTVDIPITLSRASPDAGLNYIVAAFVDSAGRTGPVSAPIVLVPEDCSAPPPRSMTLSMTGTTIAWTPLPGATSYDLVRGDLGVLRSSGGDFTAATSTCIADNWPGTSRDDAAVPASGGGWFYLARGVSCGGSGTYDSAGEGQAAPRDLDIDLAPGSCP